MGQCVLNMQTGITESHNPDAISIDQSQIVKIFDSVLEQLNVGVYFLRRLIRYEFVELQNKYICSGQRLRGKGSAKGSIDEESVASPIVGLDYKWILSAGNKVNWIIKARLR